MDAPQEKTTPLRVEEVVDAVDLLSVDKQELLNGTQYQDQLRTLQEHIHSASWPGELEADDDLAPEEQEAMFLVMQLLIDHKHHLLLEERAKRQDDRVAFDREKERLIQDKLTLEAQLMRESEDLHAAGRGEEGYAAARRPLLQAFTGCIMLKDRATPASFRFLAESPRSLARDVPLALVLQCHTPFKITGRLKASASMLETIARQCAHSGCTILARLGPSAGPPGPPRPANGHGQDPLQDSIAAYLGSRGVLGVARVAEDIIVHWTAPCAWSHSHLEALTGVPPAASGYLLGLVTQSTAEGVTCLSPSPSSTPEAIPCEALPCKPPQEPTSWLDAPTPVHLAAPPRVQGGEPHQAPLGRPLETGDTGPTQEPSPPEHSAGHDPEWQGEEFQEDDCGGDVASCEARIFDKIRNFLAGRRTVDLFKQLNKRGSGELDVTEWIDGMQHVVRCRCSARMLQRVYYNMELGEDHLGVSITNENLSYREFAKKVAHLRTRPRSPTYYDPFHDQEALPLSELR